MANILDYLDNDLTLSAMSDVIHLTQQENFRPRTYLGMSEIGEDCWRMLWYRFRNVLNDGTLNFHSILAIEDGYRQEEIMAGRLRLLPFIKLNTVDPETGSQYAFKLISGHFAGHCDGIISGILEAPKTPHIWENKAVNVKRFEELKKLIANEGEKHALAIWDPVYYAQAVIYMQSAGLPRHYLTVETPGGRDYTSCRTEADSKTAKSLFAKAESIITSDKPLTRISNNRTFYKCGWCKMKEVCFDGKVPDVNCRTCAFSEPETKKKGCEASWKCYKKNYSFIGQGSVCEHHLFLNTLVPYKTVEADKSQFPAWIKYENENGQKFINIAEGVKNQSGLFFTSKQLLEKEYFELAFSEKKPKDKKENKLAGEI
jgi:hypothetical protein